MKQLCASLLATALLVACGGNGPGGSGGELNGSAAMTYNLDFDRVEVKRLDKGGQVQAYTLEYFYHKGASSERTPVKIVANAPVTPNQEKNLLTEGSLTRVMPDSQQFPTMKEGKIIFEQLGEPGSTASGKFYITFTTGTTLNGTFSATLQQI